MYKTIFHKYFFSLQVNTGECAEKAINAWHGSHRRDKAKSDHSELNIDEHKSMRTSIEVYEISKNGVTNKTHEEGGSARVILGSRKACKSGR